MMVEGWTPIHDDAHDLGEMARAAAVYAIPEDERDLRAEYVEVETARGLADPDAPRQVMVPVPALWPWDAKWWKPTPDNRVRELVKAGALIAAEIDRLQRHGG